LMRKRRSNKEAGLTGKGLTLIKGGTKDILVDTKTAARLLLICKALDKTMPGLDGERVNLLSMVRYGVTGPTMEGVAGSLT